MTEEFKNHRECKNFRMEVTPLTSLGYKGTCKFKSWCVKDHDLTREVNACLCEDFDEGDCCIKDTKTKETFNQEFFPDKHNIDRFNKGDITND